MAATDTVVVLGGTGFIGSELVRQLRGRVSEVRVVSTRASSQLSEGQLQYRRASTRDRSALSDVIRGATIVQHLAREADDEFVEGVRNVADLCLEHRIRRLIFASSSAALYLGGRGILDERTGPDGRPELRNPYSRSKGDAERLLLIYHETKGLPVVITRPFLVVGQGGSLAHGGLGEWPAPTCCLGFGRGQHPLPFVLVQDVADAHVRAMDAEGIEGKCFNLAGDVFISAQEYLQLVSVRSFRNFRYFPRSALREIATARLKGAAKMLTGAKAKRRSSYRDIKSATMTARIDNSAAKKMLGWKPNADLAVFVRDAIDVHVDLIPEGDLRRVDGRSGIVQLA